jgi:hypothetical protein
MDLKRKSCGLNLLKKDDLAALLIPFQSITPGERFIPQHNLFSGCQVNCRIEGGDLVWIYSAKVVAQIY